jgi:hypothetical protein
MTVEAMAAVERGRFVPAPSPNDWCYVEWFHELDAWTEYWDVYHPETRGRYYFGDGGGEPGLLTQLLPRTSYPPVFTAWTRRALGLGSLEAWLSEVRTPAVTEAAVEVEALIGRMFGRHFGAASDPEVQRDYLDAMFRFAIDALPPATERAARIADGDPRKRTAGRHALDGDVMWFAWALQLECADAIAGRDAGHALRALMMAGVAIGCAAHFAWSGHRRTRRGYAADERTMCALRERGLAWAADLPAATAEVHALYRIREWGDSA